MSSPIYRNFDQATLDREYSPSLLVPNLQDYLELYAQSSRQVREAARQLKELRYGGRISETLDFFPAEILPAPLHVYIHGGYWQQLSKEDSCFAATNFVRHGISFAAINYTLAPQASLDEIVEENRRALAWLYEHAQGLGIQRERITASGSSAGGHLVAMLLATDWKQRFKLPNSILSAACSLSGVFDLEPIRLSYVNAALNLTEEATLRNSPMYLGCRVPCPLLLCYGEIETAEFKRQSIAMQQAWQKQGQACTLMEIAGRNHFDVVYELCEPDSPVFLHLQNACM